MQEWIIIYLVFFLLNVYRIHKTYLDISWHQKSKKQIVHLKLGPLPTTYAYMSGQRFVTPSKNSSK